MKSEIHFQMKFTQLVRELPDFLDLALNILGYMTTVENDIGTSSDYTQIGVGMRT